MLDVYYSKNSNKKYFISSVMWLMEKNRAKKRQAKPVMFEP